MLKFAALTALVLLALPACSSRCLVDSQPQGASVTVDGHPCGETPVTVEFDTLWDDDRRLRVSKVGYATEERVVARTRASIWQSREFPSAVFIRLAPLEPAAVACSSCRAPVAPSAAFCGGCGARR